MTKRTLRNIIISAVIVFAYFFGRHLMVKDNPHSEWGYFFTFLYAGFFAIIVGIVMIGVLIATKKHWNSVMFFTSCFTNFVVCSIPIMWLLTDVNGVAPFLLIMFSIPPFIGVTQVVLFIKHNYKNRLVNMIEKG